MQQRDRTPDRTIARLAARSHGVVTRRELLATGVTPAQIRTRVSRGSLIGVHRGVYRAGHDAPSADSDFSAAVKACGEGALLCGRAAAHMWRLTGGGAPPPEVVSRNERRIPGVVIHRARRGGGADATSLRAIPLTTVPRTIVDLAGVLGEEALARACHEAEVKHRMTPGQVATVLNRRPSARGRASLERALWGDARVALSALERRFLVLLGERRLPLPETNRLAGGRRVDCRWPQLKLTVELDGYRYHSSRRSWELDRRREREAYARGDQFRRYTYGDVIEDPAMMLAELNTLLLRT